MHVDGAVGMSYHGSTIEDTSVTTAPKQNFVTLNLEVDPKFRC